MLIYVDINDGYKCHLENNGSMLLVETDFFDGKCTTFVEGYRYVPEGETWTRSDGVQFAGEMVSPWVDYAVLDIAQQAYEEAMAAQPDTSALQAENADMQNALNVLGVTING